MLQPNSDELNMKLSKANVLTSGFTNRCCLLKA